MDTGECYAVTKCAEVILRLDKMVKEERLDALEEAYSGTLTRRKIRRAYAS
jgi:hypothetical protein